VAGEDAGETCAVGELGRGAVEVVCVAAGEGTGSVSGAESAAEEVEVPASALTVSDGGEGLVVVSTGSGEIGAVGTTGDTDACGLICVAFASCCAGFAAAGGATGGASCETASRAACTTAGTSSGGASAGSETVVERSGGDGIGSSATAAAISGATGVESSARACAGSTSATRVVKATTPCLRPRCCRNARVKRSLFPLMNRL
jgi:hypothetical protein